MTCQVRISLLGLVGAFTDFPVASALDIRRAHPPVQKESLVVLVFWQEESAFRVLVFEIVETRAPPNRTLQRSQRRVELHPSMLTLHLHLPHQTANKIPPTTPHRAQRRLSRSKRLPQHRQLSLNPPLGSRLMPRPRVRRCPDSTICCTPARMILQLIFFQLTNRHQLNNL